MTEFRSIRRYVFIGTLLAAVAFLFVFCPSEPPIQIEHREAVLKTNLAAMREAISTYESDLGEKPQSLKDLVEQGYFRHIPEDPIVRSTSDWNVETDTDGNIIDVHSSSEAQAKDGSFYRDW